MAIRYSNYIEFTLLDPSFEIVDYIIGCSSRKDFFEDDFVTPYFTPRPWTSGLVRSTGVNIVDDFKDAVLRYFKAYIDGAAANKKIDWICIRRSLRYFLPYLQDREMIFTYIECVFELFEEYRCTDSEIIQNAIQQYLMNRLQFYGYELQCEAPFLNNYCFYEPDFQPFRFQYDRNRNCSNMPVDAWNFAYWSVESHLRPMFFQDFRATERILRYGLTLHFPHITKTSYLREVIGRLRRGSFQLVEKGGLFGSTIPWVGILRRMYPSFESQRRFYIVLLAVDVISQKCWREVFQYYRNSIESFKVYFKTSTEPIVTVEEIDRFLNFLMDGGNKEMDVANFCDEFIEEFPKSIQPYRPRTLEHLCRHRVRQRLKQMKKLPHGVWALNIPRRIKEYILLQGKAQYYYE